MEKPNVLLKDVTIIPEWSANKNSFAWKYFGKVINPKIDDNRVYCTECLSIQMKNDTRQDKLFDT